VTGFWPLVRKEVQEQRRTWKFLALVGIFTALALLISIIPFIVTEVKGEPQGVKEARNVLGGFGMSIFTLGSLVTIIIAMGSLGNERSSGTAAMTLSKPVTRSAFVAAKFLGLVLTIFAALAIASVVMYVLTFILFADPHAGPNFAGFTAVIGVWLVFVGSIAFFWSAMFSQQLLAGGLAVFLFIAQAPLSEIPGTERYWPINALEWAADHFDLGHDENGENPDTGDWWTALPITVGAIPLLSLGAWGVFRRKEL
jgi:ABC-2 type transport system permease protein